jgi:hypothetical protein
VASLFELDEMAETDGESWADAVDEVDEALDEARRGPSRPPVRTSGGGNTYRPRPNNNTVTQAQLQAALARVSGQINTNSTAIKTVDGRVRGLTSEQVRVTGALRREIADRKKESEAARREIQSTREMAAILPIISKGNPLVGLLAIGMGGSLFGGSGGSSTGDSNSNWLLPAILLPALAKSS